MSNETRDAAMAALRRLEQKGVRSVYLDGPGAAVAEPVRAPVNVAKPATVGTALGAGGLFELAQTVFGVGNPNAKLMFIGEAPGADEDAKGEPFVGRAGQLLTKIIGAMGLTREEVYIANILKCRPPQNRDPLPSEVECCEEYLRAQIAMIKPKYICALGRIAAHWLLKTEAPLGVLRAGNYTYEGIPIIVTYHPAALLRNPAFKAPCWEDMKKLMALLKEA